MNIDLTSGLHVRSMARSSRVVIIIALWTGEGAAL
jgi:hypothetical protein